MPSESGCEAVKVVQVAFAGNMVVLYDFFTDQDLAPDDIVVCDTQRGPSIGKVVNVISSSVKANRWIICMIDYAAFQLRAKELDKQRQEAELAELLG
jgi:hypothetical protein